MRSGFPLGTLAVLLHRILANLGTVFCCVGYMIKRIELDCYPFGTVSGVQLSALGLMRWQAEKAVVGD